MLSDDGLGFLLVIEYRAGFLQRYLMKHLLLSALFITAGAHSASANCYADYKAKQSNPLKLHYGVAEIFGGACDLSVAKSQISERIESDGWTLLKVMEVFDESKLDSRKENAGAFFLRY